MSLSGQKARPEGRYDLVVGYRGLRAELLSPSAQVQFLANRNHVTLPPTRTPARSKVPERATLSAPCGALSPWPSAIGLHGDTPTLVTEWVWRCASCFFRPPLNLSTVESRRFRDAGLCAQVASVRRSSGRCLGCGAVGVSMDWPSPSSVGPTPPGTVPVWVYA